MITVKEVQHIAKLARLGMTKNEEEKFRKELSSVLGYMKKLEKVNVAGVNPTSQPFMIENVMRSDAIKKESKKLLSDFLKVKSIF